MPYIKNDIDIIIHHLNNKYMKKVFLSLLTSGIISLTSYAQTNPAITSWVLNTNNGTGYNCSGCNPVVHGTITTDVASVYYTSTDAYVTTSGVPSYNVGPWASNPNVPKDQAKKWKITLNPTVNNNVKTATGLGSIGIWSNGVGIYNPKDGFYWDDVNKKFASPGAGTWNRNAYVFEAVSFDACLGHADAKGSYHNHVNPKCLYDATASSVHSPIIGYAADGFPIYGAYAYTNSNGTGAIKRMTSSYVLTTATTRTNGPTMAQYAAGSFCEDYVYTQGAGDLDQYNGRICNTPEYPNGTYAYFVTIDGAGTPQYPFVVGPSYYGVVPAGTTTASATIPGGATLYVPAATAIEEVILANSRIEVFPNPAVDEVIKFKIASNISDLTVKVIDYQGRVLINKFFIANTYSLVNSIEVPFLNAGIYWVSFEYNGKKEVRKIQLNGE